MIDVSGPGTGKLWLVVMGQCEHNDATARNTEFIVRTSIGGNYDIALAMSFALIAGNRFALTRSCILNENQRFGCRADNLNGASVMTLKYIAYQFNIGESPAPSIG